MESYYVFLSTGARTSDNHFASSFSLSFRRLDHICHRQTGHWSQRLQKCPQVETFGSQLEKQAACKQEEAKEGRQPNSMKSCKIHTLYCWVSQFSRQWFACFCVPGWIFRPAPPVTWLDYNLGSSWEVCLLLAGQKCLNTWKKETIYFLRSAQEVLDTFIW